MTIEHERDEREHEALTCWRHPDRETGLRCTRCDRPTCHECLRPAPVGSHCLGCLKDAAPSAAKVRVGVPRAATGFVPRSAVAAIVAVCAVAFVLQQVTPSGQSGVSDFTERFSTIGLLIASGEWWRLVTAIFLHHGFGHLAMNMIALIVLGPENEAREGWRRFLFVFLLAGVVGNVAGYVIESPFAIGAGASGGVFGLFGMSLIYAWHHRADVQQLLVILAINVVIGITVPAISLAGHAGGFAVGLGYALVRTKVPTRYRRAVEVGAFVVLAVVVAVAYSARTDSLL